MVVKILSRYLPCINTFWTSPQVAKSLVTPYTAKPRGQFPEILVPPYAGFWCHSLPIPVFCGIRILVHHNIASNQQSQTHPRHPGKDPLNPNLKCGQAECNLLSRPIWHYISIRVVEYDGTLLSVLARHAKYWIYLLQGFYIGNLTVKNW